MVQGDYNPLDLGAWASRERPNERRFLYDAINKKIDELLNDPRSRPRAKAITQLERHRTRVMAPYYMSIEARVQHENALLSRAHIGESTHPLYHGTRRMEPLVTLYARGICTHATWVDAREQIRQALREAGKEHLLRSSGASGQRLQHLIREMENAGRRAIYLTTFKEAACEWARQGPEQVALALESVGVNPYPILRRLYGPPYVVELVHSLRLPQGNFGTQAQCIEPRDIREITPCEEAAGAR